LPTEIFTTPSEHFKNITFKNFRRFKELTINNIGQFNLIVGDNNVGKTSVLEGLLFSPDSQEFAKRLAYSYADRCNGLEFKDIKQDFWKDFLLNTQKDETIQYTLSAQRKQWQYKFPDGSIDISTLRELEYIDSIKTPMIPFGKGFRGDLKTAYEQEISPSKPLRKEFVENMKVFIPEIEGITGHKDGGIGIEEKDVDESTSLHQFGEGANKLFRILMQMTFQKNGRIMIDEIDAGIHYTRFPKFWEVILKVAYQNKIQIFATTHNLECIQHFKDVLDDYELFENMMTENEFEEFKQKSRVITLKESANNNIKTYTRTFEEFEYALERGSMYFRGGANE
jgi:AAA15 family ATPase/GTPase